MARDRESRPEARPLRLFVATDVPEEIRAGLAARVEPFRDRIPGARWTRPESWHVTLKFLGSTWPRLLDEVQGAVERAAASSASFESWLTEMGVFPGPRRARVVWAGLADPDERFAPIVSELDQLLAQHFVPERRAFTPHLTLARLNPPRDLREGVPDLVGVSLESSSFPVDHLTLYRSHLSPRGATYEPLVRVPLRA